MITTTNIEDRALLLTYCALQVAVTDNGNLVCAQIVPALRMEIEYRRDHGGKPRAASKSRIILNLDGIDENDFFEARCRLSALGVTWNKYHQPRARQFADQLLQLVTQHEKRATQTGNA